MNAPGPDSRKAGLDQAKTSSGELQGSPQGVKLTTTTPPGGQDNRLKEMTLRAKAAINGSGLTKALQYPANAELLKSAPKSTTSEPSSEGRFVKSVRHYGHQVVKQTTPVTPRDFDMTHSTLSRRPQTSTMTLSKDIISTPSAELSSNFTHLTPPLPPIPLTSPRDSKLG